MRGAIAKSVVVLVAGLALIAAKEYRKQPASAPVQPVALSLPQVRLNFPVGPLPVEDVDVGAIQRIDRAEPRQQVEQEQTQRDAPPEAIAADAQRVQDAKLLEEQEASSERQQEELNRDIERDVKTQEEMQAEPRIQGVPEVPVEAVPVESTQPE
jgi:hypothetical protein